MVKKIRVIEDSVSSDETSEPDRNLMELAKSMDWKLWEILLIMQKLEKSLKGMNFDVSGSELDVDTTKGSKK
jgi:hypothetical protein